jgi:hypothetical protein
MVIPPRWPLIRTSYYVGLVTALLAEEIDLSQIDACVAAPAEHRFAMVGPDQCRMSLICNTAAVSARTCWHRAAFSARD